MASRLSALGHNIRIKFENINAQKALVGVFDSLTTFNTSGCSSLCHSFSSMIVSCFSYSLGLAFAAERFVCVVPHSIR